MKLISLENTKQQFKVGSNMKARETKQIENLTMLELMKQRRAFQIKQEKEIKLIDNRVAQIESSTSQEAISDKVDARLKENGLYDTFPKDCMPLYWIRDKIFGGISETIISRFLNSINHPTELYNYYDSENIMRKKAVFKRDKLQEAFERLISESYLQKKTDQYYFIGHRLLGNYRIKLRSCKAWVFEELEIRRKKDLLGEMKLDPSCVYAN